MNKKIILCVIGIVVTVGIIVASCMYLSGGRKPADSSLQESAQTEKTTTDPSSGQAESEIDTPFLLLESKEPTLQGKTGYFDELYQGTQSYLEYKKFADEFCTEDTAVEGIKTVAGNQVYETQVEGLDPQYFQLFGYTPDYVDQDGWMSDMTLVRQEFTGKRIYILPTQEKVDEYKDQWDKGQAILSGKESGTKGDIIVNGRYIAKAKYIDVSGEYYIPLINVSEAVNESLYSVDIDNSIVYVPIHRTDGYTTLGVPYGATLPGSTHYTDFFTAGDEYGATGEPWTEQFQTGDGMECYVPASELSRYTGWYIYSNGNVISIVTDETEVTDMFVLNTQGNRSAEEQLKDGDTVVKNTDLFDENLQQGSDAASG